LAQTERLNDTKTETKMRTKTEILTETNTETESFRLLIVSHFFACFNFFGPLIHGLIVKFNSKLKVNYNKNFNDYSVQSFGGIIYLIQPRFHYGKSIIPIPHLRGEQIAKIHFWIKC